LESQVRNGRAEAGRKCVPDTALESRADIGFFSLSLSLSIKYLQFQWESCFRTINEN